jgi:hypothetical protein
VIKKFFNDLFSTGDAVSSKRVISFFVLINLIIFAYISTFNSDSRTTPEFMYDALALIVGGGLGFTAIEKIFLGKYTKNFTEEQPPTNSDDKEPNKPRKPRKGKYPKSDDTN